MGKLRTLKLGLIFCSSALVSACSGNGSTGGDVMDGGTLGDAAPGSGADMSTLPAGCLTLNEQPLAVSPITWNNFPACDTSGFCVTYPAPMNEIVTVATTPAGTNWIAGQNTLASWRGSQGSVYRLDTTLEIEGIYALADDNIWAVGSGSLLAHFDGSQWTQSLLSAPSYLGGVWASSASDVWTVGNFGVIGHYDGSKWSAISLPGASQSMNAVHGTGPKDVWAVGNDGTQSLIEHYDGTQWKSIPVTATDILQGVWAAAADDVWIVGRNNLVLHGNLASGFTRVTVPAQLGGGILSGIWGAAANDLWISGNNDTFHWNGTTWTRSDSVGTAVRGRTAQDLVAIGPGAAQAWDGTAWKPVFTVGNSTLRAAWAVTPDDVWFVGDKGAVVRAKNGVLTGATLGRDSLVQVWGSGASDIWILDSAGTLYRGNGKNFCPVSSFPGRNPFASYWALSGSSASDVWVTSSGGPALHFDGAKWTDTGKQPVRSVIAFAPNDAWASGSALLHWDGATWSRPSTTFAASSDESFGPIWGASTNDVWTFRDDFTRGNFAAHWNGKTFTTTTDRGQAYATFNGSATNDLWSFGFDVLHWTGTSWQNLPVARLGVQATAVTAKDVWAVGQNGLVMRKTK